MALLGYEFWCTIGEEDVNRFKSTYTKDNLNEEHVWQKNCRNMLKTYFQQLIELIFANINPVDEEEEEHEVWSLSKASTYILHLLVEVIDEQSMDNILKYIESNINSDEVSLKNTCLLLLVGCCTTSLFKVKMQNSIKNHLNKIVQMLFDRNESVKKNSSLLLIKITKHLVKRDVFVPAIIEALIPMMMNALLSSNPVACNICQALNNLIRGLGDLETNKNSNPLSPYFETIFKELVNHAFRNKAFDKDNNLTMNTFLTLSLLIDYSSHDKQDKMIEILSFFTIQFEATLTDSSKENFMNMSSNNSTEIISQLQAYYCTIFRSVFKKMLKTTDLERGKQFYLLLEGSFKQREAVYEEAVLCLGALAENMGSNFEAIATSFQDYLLYALQKFNESSLNYCAIITLGEIVKAIKYNFHNFSDKFIPVLINILTHEEVGRGNKTAAILTIGDICLNINEHFLPHYESIMQLFLEAAQMASENVDEDEETEEYMQNFRFELIEAFTCIFFALSDCNKKELFVPYVPHIFNFFRTITADKYKQRPVN